MLFVSLMTCFSVCTASKRLTLSVSDLSSIQPQLAYGEIVQSKIHIRVHTFCRIRLVEYFQIVSPSNLQTDDVGKLLWCMQFCDLYVREGC